MLPALFNVILRHILHYSTSSLRSNDLGCIAMSALEKTYKKRAPDRGALLTLLRMFT
jgi:hypothetical protein